MADVITIQDLVDGRLDVKGIATFLNGDAGVKVPRRLADEIDTLEHYLDYMRGLQAVYEQPDGMVEVNGVKVKPVKVALDDALNAAVIGGGGLADTAVATVPISGTLGGARTLNNKLKENTSVMDFFTVSERNSYFASPTTFDAHRPIQAFFDYISVNDVGTAYCSGDFYISKSLNVGSTTKCLTKNIVGNLRLVASQAMTYMLKFNTGKYFKWVGSVEVNGQGSVSIAGRTCLFGIILGDGGEAARNSFDSLIANRFKYFGVYFGQSTTLTNSKILRASMCGSGGRGYSLSSTFTLLATEGSSGSGSQLSRLSVDVLPPSDYATYTQMSMSVKIGGEYHNIINIDTVGKTIEVFPWVNTSTTETNLEYLFGGGVGLRGGDASCVTFDRVDVADCGIGVHDAAQYGAYINMLVTQSCGVGYIRGNTRSNVNYGGGAGSFYTESCDCYLLVLSTLSKFRIEGTYEFSYPKVKFAMAANTSKTQSINGGDFSNIDFLGATANRKLTSAGSSIVVPVAGSEGKPYTYRADSTIFNLSVIDVQALGNVPTEMIVISGSSTAVNYAPGGTLTFTPPTGYTLNGSSGPLGFSGFNGPARFTIILYLTNIILICDNLSPTSPA